MFIETIETIETKYIYKLVTGYKGLAESGTIFEPRWTPPQGRRSV